MVRILIFVLTKTIILIFISTINYDDANHSFLFHEKRCFTGFYKIFFI